MITLSPTLLAAQKKASRKPAVRLTLTRSGKPSYEITDTRILKITHSQEPWLEDATLLLDNSDGYFTGKELEGYTVVIGYGLITKDGAEYISRAPMEVSYQALTSQEGKLTCELYCIGQASIMSEDRANSEYTPVDDEGNATDTIKQLIDGILKGTMAAYNDLPKFTVTYDSGYDDGLINSFKPGKSFRITLNTTRINAIKRLLRYTYDVMLPKPDGAIHILKPITSGNTYAYEYALDSHVFYSKVSKDNLIRPNWITVSDYDETVSGEAKIPNVARVYKQHEKYYNIESDAQAKKLAEAILAEYQSRAEVAAAVVPMNLGAELYDYVKVTDSREGTTITGNIGYIRWQYTPGKYQMSFGFGGWLSMRKTMIALEGESGGETPWDAVFNVIYAKYIKAEMIDFTDITYDLIEDGIHYHGVKSAQINAAGLIFTDALSQVDENGNPCVFGRVKRASLTADGLILTDELVDGTYGKVKTAALSADGLVLLDQTVEGTYGKVYAADLSAGHLNLTALTTIEGQAQAVVGVFIDADAGITIRGGKLRLEDSGGNHGASLYIDTSGYIRLDNWGWSIIDNIRPVNGTGLLGDTDHYWDSVYLLNVRKCGASGSGDIGQNDNYFNAVHAANYPAHSPKLKKNVDYISLLDKIKVDKDGRIKGGKEFPLQEYPEGVELSHAVGFILGCLKQLKEKYVQS